MMIPKAPRFILVAVLAISAILTLAASPASAHGQRTSTGSHPVGLRPHVAVSESLMVTPNMVVVGTTATVRGTGFNPNSRVFVFWRRPDGTRHGVFGMTTMSGTFAFRLGFAPRHGIGTELVAATDLATGMSTPVVSVTVSPRGIGSGMISATMNPVPKGGVTLIAGLGFTPGSVVVVQWRRPDGTMGAIRVLTDSMGSFAFRLRADPQHGCGTRTFTALDLSTLLANGPGPLILGEMC